MGARRKRASSHGWQLPARLVVDAMQYLLAACLAPAERSATGMLLQGVCAARRIPEPRSLPQSAPACPAAPEPAEKAGARARRPTGCTRSCTGAQGEVDTDSIGNVICRKAREVDAAAVVMASHTRSKLTEFFLGSVTNYCTRAPALPGPWHPWIGPPVQPRDRVRSCLRACASACGVCMYPGRTRV